MKQISYLKKYKNQETIIGPTKINIIAIFPIPKSYSKKQREYILKENNYHTKKSDIDNICKIILDALNGLAYNDDTQILKIIAEKKYTFEQEKVNIINKNNEKRNNK